MPQSGSNADANRRAQGKASAGSASATSKPSTVPAKAASAKEPGAKVSGAKVSGAKPRAAKPAGSTKPAKPQSGNGADVLAKAKPAVPTAAQKAQKDAEMKDKKDKKKSKKLLKRLEKAAKGEKNKAKDKDKGKDKKKSHSSGRVNAEIDYESRMNRDEAVAYFDALIAGLKQGSVRFKQGEETVVIRPSDLVDVEIKARSSGRKEKVRFEISWLSEYSGKMSITSD